MLQIEEIKASIKFQLKKVLCLGVAIGHVAMADKVTLCGAPCQSRRSRYYTHVVQCASSITCYLLGLTEDLTTMLTYTSPATLRVYSRAPVGIATSRTLICQLTLHPG